MSMAHGDALNQSLPNIIRIMESAGEPIHMSTENNKALARQFLEDLFMVSEL